MSADKYVDGIIDKNGDVVGIEPPVPTETLRGGIYAKQKTNETEEVVIDPQTGKAYVKNVTQIDHGTADTTFTLPANEYHTWGEVSSLTLTLAAGTSGQASGYWFAFDSGATATTLSIPETVKTDIVVEPNMHYECIIVGNYMTFCDWEVTV